MYEQIGFAHLKTCPDNLVLIKLKLLGADEAFHLRIQVSNVTVFSDAHFQSRFRAAVKQI